ncbi:hypothetical protein ES703_60151 [subsurface metagenome]
MAKLKNPLISLGATGALTKALTFVRRRKQNLIEKTPVVPDAKSPGQLAWRHMYQKCAALWHTLSASERLDWESRARILHMTGFAYWQSQCLKPNPGIYLPLQGGTMQGAIDMDGHHIHGLPLPIHLQDPLRRQDYVDYIQPHLHFQGARVTHSVDQAIPHATTTTLAFDEERYDTDAIHDNAVFNNRLTCKTAGNYLIIGGLVWSTHNVGGRYIHIRLNGVTIIGYHIWGVSVALGHRPFIATIYDLALTDYVELRVRQESGAALDVIRSGQNAPLFMMQRIG